MLNAEHLIQGVERRVTGSKFRRVGARVEMLRDVCFVADEQFAGDKFGCGRKNARGRKRNQKRADAIVGINRSLSIRRVSELRSLKVRKRKNEKSRVVQPRLFYGETKGKLFTGGQ